MQHKKLTILVALFALMIVGMAAVNPPDDGPKNLKVLPKNISHEDLDKVMDGWKSALGVHCNFCHAPSADSTSHHLDFASDAKPEKNIARHMYKMTGKINKKYFSFAKDDKGASIAVVSCVTCHRGSPHPDEVK
jgi:cytochrome c553